MKKRNEYDPKQVETLLNTKATEELQKMIDIEIEQKQSEELSGEQLVALSTIQPLISSNVVDPQEREDYERKKEAKIIDKMDAGFGAKIQTRPRPAL